MPVPNANYVSEEFAPYTWFNNAQSGFLAGTTKFNLEYDPDNAIFYIDYTHSPILDTAQHEVALFSAATQQYRDIVGTAGNRPCNIGYRANGSLGGIVISQLFSLELNTTFVPVSQTDVKFWQINLGFGFDSAYRTQFLADFVNRSFTVYNNSRGPSELLIAQYTYDITYPNLKYLKSSCTDALIPIQWLQQSNYTNAAGDKGMSIYSTDIPKTFQSIGTRVIYGDSGAFQAPIAYYLIEINISHLKNDNYRDQDSFRQIMNICGKTYTTGSFVQSFDDGSVQAVNVNEDIFIDKIEVKILNPDKSLATSLGLGTIIFLKLTQPLIVMK